jgi:hypothetical protein
LHTNFEINPVIASLRNRPAIYHVFLMSYCRDEEDAMALATPIKPNSPRSLFDDGMDLATPTPQASPHQQAQPFQPRPFGLFAPLADSLVDAFSPCRIGTRRSQSDYDAFSGAPLMKLDENTFSQEKQYRNLKRMGRQHRYNSVPNMTSVN